MIFRVLLARIRKVASLVEVFYWIFREKELGGQADWENQDEI